MAADMSVKVCVVSSLATIVLISPDLYAKSYPETMDNDGTQETIV